MRVLSHMRLTALLFTAILTAASAAAQQTPASPKPETTSSSKDAAKNSEPGTQNPEPRTKNAEPGTPNSEPGSLPVSLDKIKEALQQPPVQVLRGLNDKPTFRVEIHERQRIALDDLIESLDFKAGPVPGGGLYGYEMQRQMWPATSNPIRQPYAAFSQGQLLTILVENLVGRYLAGKAGQAITNAMREHAIAAAREEVQHAIAEYCAAQPNAGAGIQICAKPVQ